jgi:deazaflavin-dependent oxidoreductase (nitroreductase family)
MTDIEKLAGEQYCYLTTTGRVSGRPHEIEIWFGLSGRTLYMLSGGGERSDWVRNLLRKPAVTVRIASTPLRGAARVVEPATTEDRRARRLLLRKYQPLYEGDLADWSRNALPVAVDIEVREPPKASARRARQSGA